MALTTVDTDKLAALAKRCYMTSMRGTVSEDLQDALLDIGDRLSSLWKKLVAKKFEQGTASVKRANDRMKQINAQLDAAADDLDKLTKVTENIGKLIGALDKLVGVAISLV